MIDTTAPTLSLFPIPTPSPRGDNTAPTLKLVSFPSRIDVSGGAQPITITAIGNDEPSFLDSIGSGLPSGIQYLRIQLDRPLNYSINYVTGSTDETSSFIYLFGVPPDTWEDGQTAATVTISPSNVGAYYVENILFTDKAGNTSHYFGQDVLNLGAPLRFVITNTNPATATTANMILRRGDGTSEIYDIGNNKILAADPLSQVGSDWQFVGLGLGNDATDMCCAKPARARSRSTTSAKTRSSTPASWARSASTGR